LRKSYDNENIQPNDFTVNEKPACLPGCGGLTIEVRSLAGWLLAE